MNDVYLFSLFCKPREMPGPAMPIRQCACGVGVWNESVAHVVHKDPLAWWSLSVGCFGLVFGASGSQNSFPTWGSGCEARLMMFHLRRPIEVGNGIGVTPVYLQGPSLWGRLGLRDAKFQGLQTCLCNKSYFYHCYCCLKTWVCTFIFIVCFWQ